MKVLLDENIPRKLKWRLIEPEFEILTVPERGWAGMTNGELLSRAEAEFDVLLTMDQGIEYQRNVSKHALGIIVIAAPTNEYETLVPLVAEIEEALRKVETGEVVSVTV
jgi:predicted nuclease of predicted toxin-antitoxin system